MNKPGLIFLIFWLSLVIIGLVRPQLYLPMAKWNMKLLGRMYGFNAEPQPDEVIIRKMRLWYGFFLLFGSFVLWMVLTGRAE